MTTDDLLRRQEEPLSKRIRLSPQNSDEESDNPGNSSDSSESQSTRSSDARISKKDDEDHDGTDDEDVDCLDTPPSQLEVEGRFNFARVTEKSRTKASQISNVPRTLPTSFESLAISAPLQAALSSMSIRTPTEIQAACIPPLLSGESFLYVYFQTNL